MANIAASFPQGEWGWKIQFLNRDISFVSLENFDAGAILKTTDGGQNWVRLPISDPQKNVNLEGVGFIDEQTGWVGGWGSADFQSGFTSATQNGGETWKNANDVGRFINRFRFFGNPVTLGYACGRTIYKYTSTPPRFEVLAAASIRPQFLATNNPEHSHGSTSIEYVIPEGAKRTAIHIWDQFGALVRALVDEIDPVAERKTVSWDGRNDSGEFVGSGIFIYRLTVDDSAESRVIRFSRK